MRSGARRLKTYALKTICPLCHGSLETPYTMLGAAVECAACGASVVAEVPLGGVYPQTGYEVTFGDFCRLISDPAYRPHVLPHLREWFGMEVPLAEGGVVILADDGSAVPPLSVHQRIQADGPRQYAFYQTAMSLWR